MSKVLQPCPCCQQNKSMMRIVFSHLPEELTRGTLARRMWREGDRGDRIFMVFALAVCLGVVAIESAWWFQL